MESANSQIPANYDLSARYAISTFVVTNNIVSLTYANLANMISDMLIINKYGPDPPPIDQQEPVNISAIWIKSMEKSALHWMYPELTLGEATTQMPLWRLLPSDIATFMAANSPSYYTKLGSCYRDSQLINRYYNNLLNPYMSTYCSIDFIGTSEASCCTQFQNPANNYECDIVEIARAYGYQALSQHLNGLRWFNTNIRPYVDESTTKVAINAVEYINNLPAVGTEYNDIEIKQFIKSIQNAIMCRGTLGVDYYEPSEYEGEEGYEGHWKSGTLLGWSTLSGVLYWTVRTPQDIRSRGRGEFVQFIKATTDASQLTPYTGLDIPSNRTFQGRKLNGPYAITVTK